MENLQTTNSANDISFQQKSNIVSLVIIGGTTAYYIANIWPMRPIALETEGIPAGYGQLVVSTVAVIIIAQIVLQAVLAFGSGSTPAETEQERLAGRKGQRIASGIMAVGILAAVGSLLFIEPTAFWAANLAFLGLLVAENVKLAAQIFYAHRS